MIEGAASGRYGPAPASITVLSGDVHHAYLAEVAFRRSAGVRSAVHQAVCSPFRNALDDQERKVIEAGNSRAGISSANALARLAGVSAGADPLAAGRGPVLRQPGGDADHRRPQPRELKLERTVGDPESDRRELHTSFERSIA